MREVRNITFSDRLQRGRAFAGRNVSRRSGGMLRDIMVRRTPLVLRREIYAVAAIPGALIYYYLQEFLPKTFCMLLCAALIVAIRLLSLRFRWNLPNSINEK